MALVIPPLDAADLARQAVDIYRDLGKGNSAAVQKAVSGAEKHLKGGQDPLQVLYAVTEAMADVLHGVKDVHLNMMKINEALGLAQDAVEIFREADHKKGVACALQTAAHAYLVREDPYKAMQAATAALKFAKASDERALQADVMYTIVGCHVKKQQRSPTKEHGLKELDQAVDLANEVIELYQEQDDRKNEGMAWHRLANVYLAMEEPEDSKRAARRAMDIFTELDDSKGVAMVITSLMEAAMIGDDYDDAVDCAETGVRNARRNGDRREEGMAMNTLATVHLQCGEVDECVSKAREAGEIFQAIGEPLLQAEALETCLQVFEATGDAEQATATAREMVRLLEDTEHTSPYAGALHRLARMQLDACVKQMHKERRDHEAAPTYHAIDRELLHDAQFSAQKAAEAFRRAGDAEGAAAVAEMVRGVCEQLAEGIKAYEDPKLTYYIQKRGEPQQAISMWEVPGEAGKDGEGAPPVKIVGPNPNLSKSGTKMQLTV